MIIYTIYGLVCYVDFENLNISLYGYDIECLSMWYDPHSLESPHLLSTTFGYATSYRTYYKRGYMNN